MGWTSYLQVGKIKRVHSGINIEENAGDLYWINDDLVFAWGLRDTSTKRFGALVKSKNPIDFSDYDRKVAWSIDNNTKKEKHISNQHLTPFDIGESITTHKNHHKAAPYYNNRHSYIQTFMNKLCFNIFTFTILSLQIEIYWMVVVKWFEDGC